MIDDLYASNDFDTATTPQGYIELLARMERRLDEALRDSKGKRKHKKKGGKSKKYKKRLKALEKQNEKIVDFLRIVATQTQASKRPSLLHSFIEKSTPKLIDLASAVIKSKQKPTMKYLPTTTHPPLYLTDGRDKK